MRNLARLLRARGIAVSGSDIKDSKGMAELRAMPVPRSGSATTPARIAITRRGDHLERDR